MNITLEFVLTVAYVQILILNKTKTLEKTETVFTKQIIPCNSCINRKI